MNVCLRQRVEEDCPKAQRLLLGGDSEGGHWGDQYHQGVGGRVGGKEGQHKASRDPPWVTHWATLDVYPEEGRAMGPPTSADRRWLHGASHVGCLSNPNTPHKWLP